MSLRSPTRVLSPWDTAFRAVSRFAVCSRGSDEASVERALCHAREYSRNGTLVVEEGSVVTVAYSTSGLLDPTITVGGEPISNGGTFVAGSDTTLRVVFFVDDDDDNPVNPPVVATGDDDDIVYAVAIAAGVIVAVFVAVYVIYGRKD